MNQPQGFAEFVAARSPALLRSAWWLTGEWPAAEDLVQSALARVWSRWPSIDDNLPAQEAYVRRVITNLYLAGRKRRWRGETSYAQPPDHAEMIDHFSRADDRHQLAQALRGLPARQRTAIVLRFFDDLTEVATAAAMGCSVGTVKTHTARGLTALRSVPGLTDDQLKEVP